ncbi:MAG: S41 family peptidase [Planctomycetota bacterium]|nr:MAG: S41 family peptidase [Planctomycetota bacterium]
MRTVWTRIAGLGLLAGCSLASWAQAEDTPKNQDEYFELMQVFVDTFDEIDQNYVKDVDRRQLIESAIRGMLSDLDPYSDYISPEELAKFNESVDQEFVGVGIQVRFLESIRAIEVSTPLPGSPAYKAGIQAGDRIVQVADKKVSDFEQNREMESAIAILRGKPGEIVKVGYTRGDSTEINYVDLKREVIQLDSVLGDSYKADGSWNFMLDPEKKIGYVRLTHFTSRSGAEMRQALKALKSDGFKGLIIDVRFNPGGYLQTAVEIADLFLEDGVIVSTEGRNSRPVVRTAKKAGTFTGFPIVVMTNRYSASASEILAAALQDHQRGVVVGERTWGKGSVQNTLDVEDGKSKLKLTTASYYRPSKEKIHRFPGETESDKWGVMPNDGLKIEFTMEQMRVYNFDRAKRDVITKEPIPSTFDDIQLKKAREVIEQEIVKAAAPAQPADSDPAPDDKKDDEKPADDKKAARIPFFPTTLKYGL